MTSRRARPALALAVAASILLSSCAADVPLARELDRDPHPVAEPLREVAAADMRLPTPFEELRLLDPGWDALPRFAADTYLGTAEQDGHLEFTAVGTDGEVRWRAERPLTCAGFALSTDAQGRALAILTDTRSTSDAVAEVTASAFELDTGRRVWGPVAVPGPHQGPGLVFAAPSAELMGESGARVVLDPTTGQVVASEDDPGVGRVVGEYHGTVVLAERGELVAIEASTRSELWRVTADELGRRDPNLRALPERTASESHAVIGAEGPAGSVVDLATGRVVSRSGERVVIDATTGTVVVHDDDELHAFDDDGELMWSTTVGPETTIEALGGVFLYLREGDTVRVHNVLTGNVAQAYEPDGAGTIVVPAYLPTSMGGVLLHDRQLLLAALEG